MTELNVIKGFVLPNKEVFEKLGFIFHDDLDDERKFKVLLPLEWKVKEVNGIRYFYDNLDRMRGTIGSAMSKSQGLKECKGEFICLSNRYGLIEHVIEKDSHGELIEYGFGSFENILHKTGRVYFRKNATEEEWKEATDAAALFRNQALQYGSLFYPNFTDVEAYWNFDKDDDYSIFKSR